MSDWWTDSAAVDEKRAKIQECLDEVLEGYMLDTWVICFHGVESGDLEPGGGHLMNESASLVKVIGMLDVTKVQLLGDQLA